MLGKIQVFCVITPCLLVLRTFRKREAPSRTDSRICTWKHYIPSRHLKSLQVRTAENPGRSASRRIKEMVNCPCDETPCDKGICGWSELRVWVRVKFYAFTFEFYGGNCVASRSGRFASRNKPSVCLEYDTARHRVSLDIQEMRKHPDLTENRIPSIWHIVSVWISYIDNCSHSILA
jgi:hypothetical protein